MDIREEMRNQKISQGELAYQLNLTQAAISQKLSGKVEWSLWEIMNVFDILGIDFDYERRSND